MNPRTAPAGQAFGGALTGWNNSPGVGLQEAAGPFMGEDWMRYGDSGNDYGETGWTLTTIGGGGASVVLSAPTSAADMGIGALRTGTSTNRGATLNTQSVQMMFKPPIGMVWGTKVQLSSVLACDAWTGFVGSTSSRVRTADNSEFIGLRFNAAGAGTWEGVCKNGSGSGAETVVDLGAASAATWIRVMWEAVDTDGAGTMGIQWYTLDCDERRQVYRTKVGDPVTTNHPQGTGPCAMGIVTTTNAQKIIYQDWWSFGGRTAR